MYEKPSKQFNDVCFCNEHLHPDTTNSSWCRRQAIFVANEERETEKGADNVVVTLKETENVVVTLKELMLKSIRWYRNTLSPIMPPNCRFLPSCSQYGLDAIDKFGPIKGGVLIAWRIARCNPFGGSGYDPPVWPPPSWFSGSNSRR